MAPQLRRFGPTLRKQPEEELLRRLLPAGSLSAEMVRRGREESAELF
jgi:hypothetical protein